VAANDARWICKKRYGRAPRVEIVGDDLTMMTIIPEHLYYVLLVRRLDVCLSVCLSGRDGCPSHPCPAYPSVSDDSLRFLSRLSDPQELVKNSLRAVSEKHLRDLMAEPPESIECMDDGDGLPGFAPAAAPPSRVPPIRVTISRDYSLLDGRQIQITVADEGGG